MAPGKKEPSTLPFYLCNLLGILLPQCACCESCTPCDVQRPQVQPSGKVFTDNRAFNTVDGNAFKFNGKKMHKRMRRKPIPQMHRRSVQLVDSGASICCITDLSLFDSITEWHPDAHVRVANNQTMQATAIGTITLRVYNDRGKIETLKIENVFYLPEFHCNLLSTKQLWKQCGYKSVFTDKSYLKGPSGRRCYFDNTENNQLHAFSANATEPDLWHKRFMHASNQSLSRVHGLSGFDPKAHDSSKCPACLQGGAKKLSPRRLSGFKQRKRYVYFGERVSSDLCGPFPEAIHGKYKYAIVFHDSATKNISVYPLRSKEKEEVLEAFQDFLVDNKGKLTKGVGLWHTDQGGEFTSKDTDAFCEEICVKRSYSVPFEPWQNPYAERSWGNLLRKIRTALVDSQVPHSFWWYAMRYASYIHNRIPSADGELSPEEKSGGRHMG